MRSGPGRALRARGRTPERAGWRVLAPASAQGSVCGAVREDRDGHLGRGHTLVRTAFRNDLVPLADAWTEDATKAVPKGLALDGATLRVWVTAYGRWIPGGYLLGLDENAPETHEPLEQACIRIGLQVTLTGMRNGGPGLRLTGRRRIGRLVELVGDPPTVGASEDWPTRAFSRSGEILSRA
ncbi:hypothetical protein GCM10029964_001290 [Kibdelosporangium lantanae]